MRKTGSTISFALILILLSALGATLLAGCKDGEGAAKATQNLQKKRQERSNRAIDMVDPAPK